MFIIGWDYHPSVQQIAWVDKESGECGGLRLRQGKEAEQCYRELKKKRVSGRGVGIEKAMLASDGVEPPLPDSSGLVCAVV